MNVPGHCSTSFASVHVNQCQLTVHHCRAHTNTQTSREDFAPMLYPAISLCLNWWSTTAQGSKTTKFFFGNRLAASSLSLLLRAFGRLVPSWANRSCVTLRSGTRLPTHDAHPPGLSPDSSQRLSTFSSQPPIPHASILLPCASTAMDSSGDEHNDSEQYEQDDSDSECDVELLRLRLRWSQMEMARKLKLQETASWTSSALYLFLFCINVHHESSNLENSLLTKRRSIVCSLILL
ncbi:hypothetical protein IWX49DRAFT_66238 [Phyllosticta citricarpa]